MTSTEQWVDVINYEDLYQVSNFGRVRRKGNVLKNRKQSSGYLSVYLSKKGEGKQKLVHRIEYQSFNPNKDLKNLDINHKDGNKQNNYLDNLESVTRKENIIHACLVLGKKMVCMKGKYNPMSRSVIQYDKQMKRIKIWFSIHDAKRDLGISDSNIIRCCKGQRKTAGGFIWRYGDEN